MKLGSEEERRPGALQKTALIGRYPWSAPVHANHCRSQEAKKFDLLRRNLVGCCAVEGERSCYPLSGATAKKKLWVRLSTPVLTIDTCGTRGDPIGLAGRRLDHSAKVSMKPNKNKNFLQHGSSEIRIRNAHTRI